jgi:hypothetical protein
LRAELEMKVVRDPAGDVAIGRHHRAAIEAGLDLLRPLEPGSRLLI